MAAIKNDSAGAAWWRDVFQGNAANGWECMKSVPQLKLDEKEPTHLLMEGTLFDRAGMVHAGVLRIPESGLKTWLRLVADDPTTVRYVHEVAGPQHPVYFDFDMEQVPTVRLIELYAAVIDAAGLTDGLEPFLFESYKIKLPAAGGDGAVQRVLERESPASPDGVSHWGWGQVMKAMIDPECTTAMPDVTSPMLDPDEQLLQPVSTLFVLAVAKIVWGVVRGFFPSKEETSRHLEMRVLTNHNHTTRKMEFPVEVPRRGKYRAIKVGAHLIMRLTIVKRESMEWIWQAVVDHFVEHFPLVPGDMTAEAFWTKAFDRAPYSNPIGGLRMPLSCKAKKCPTCEAGEDARKACFNCNRRGKVHEGRYYGYIATVQGDDAHPGCGEIAQSANVRDRMKVPFSMLQLCCLRGPKVKLSPIDLTGRREPTRARAIEQRRIEQRFGAAAGKSAINRAARRQGIDLKGDDARADGLLAAINDFAAIDLPAKPPAASSRIYLGPGDPRFTAVSDFLKLFMQSQLPEKYEHVYADLRVKSATMVLDGPDGEPLHMYVSIAGPTTARCFNRVVETDDPAYRFGALVRKDCQDAGVVEGKLLPGEHNNWGCTYYKIAREGNGTVTQLCSNTNCRGTRRNGRARGNKPASCKEWTGHVMPIPEEHRLIVRHIFYTPDEQDRRLAADGVVAQARRLQKRYKMGSVFAVGPVDEYEAWAGLAVKAAQRKRKKTDEIKPSDVFGDDASVRPW